MPPQPRRWLRGTLEPLESSQDDSIIGPPNFSRYPRFDLPESEATAFWTWVKDEKSAWTLLIRVYGELQVPILQEYDVEVSFMLADAPESLLPRNTPITVGVRCPAATLTLTEGAA